MLVLSDEAIFDNESRTTRTRPMHSVRPRRVAESDSFQLLTPTIQSPAPGIEGKATASVQQDSTDDFVVSPPPRKTVGSRHALLMQSFGEDDEDTDKEEERPAVNSGENAEQRVTADSGDAPLSPSGEKEPCPFILTTSLLTDYYLLYNASMISRVEALVSQYQGKPMELSDQLKKRYNVSLGEFAERRKIERQEQGQSATPSCGAQVASSRLSSSQNNNPQSPRRQSSTAVSSQSQSQASTPMKANVAQPSVGQALPATTGEADGGVQPRRQDLSVPEALRLYFSKYNPANVERVDMLLEQYDGNVAALSADLEKKYNAPLYSVTSEALGASPLRAQPRRPSVENVAAPSGQSAGRPRAANSVPLPQSPQISRNILSSFSPSPSTAPPSEKQYKLQAELALALENADRKAEELLLREEQLFQQQSSMEEAKKALEQRQEECAYRERLIEKLESTYQQREEEVHQREVLAAALSAENDDKAAKLRAKEEDLKREFVEAYKLLELEKRKVLKFSDELTTNSEELQDLARRLQLTVGEANAKFRFRSSVLRDQARVIEAKHLETLVAEAHCMHPMAGAQFDRVDVFGKLLVALGLIVVIIGAACSVSFES